MLILRGEIEKKKRKKVEKDLQRILIQWKWGAKSFTTTDEFLTRMVPWITQRIREEKEVKEFLKKKGVGSLSEL